MKGKKVLVEEKHDNFDLWSPKFEGVIIAETDTRFKVRYSWFSKPWVPKDGVYLRCRIIK